MICRHLQKKYIYNQYGDDSQILHAASVNYLNEIIAKTKQTVTEAEQYFDMNGLKLNPKET